MPTPQLNLKDPKTPLTRKPTAQELHQKTSTKSPAVNPTNAGTGAKADTPLNNPAGYSAPDAPSEGDDTVDALKPDTTSNDGGDKEVPNPVQDTPVKMDGDYPVQDNPKM